MHSVLIMNPHKTPGKKKSKRKGSTMANKSKTAKKKTTKTKRNPARKVYKKKATKRKVRRNPRPSSMTKRLGYLMPEVLAVMAGFMGARALVNSFLAQKSGYIRGGVQMIAGVGAGVLAEMFLGKKKKTQQLCDGLVVGGLLSGGITLFDTATGGNYKDIFLADDVTYLGGNAGEYINMLPEVSGVGEYVNAGSGAYLTNPSYL